MATVVTKPAPMPADVDELSKQYLEQQKVVFDYIKHLTTLASGSVVVLATLLEKFFTKPSWRPLVPGTFAALVVSIVSLCLAAFCVIRSIRTPRSLSSSLVNATALFFGVGVLSFVVAMIC